MAEPPRTGFPTSPAEVCRRKVTWQQQRTFSLLHRRRRIAVRKATITGINAIHSNRSYSIKEITRLLKVHPRTVSYWIKEGLQPNDPNERPLLFAGFVLKNFLRKRRDRRKIDLGPDMFLCPRCHMARRAKPNSIHAEPSNRRIGRDQLQVIIHGNCRVCGCNMHRFTTNKLVETTVANMKFTKRNEGLKCEQLGFVFTDLEGV